MVVAGSAICIASDGNVWMSCPEPWGLAVPWRHGAVWAEGSQSVLLPGSLHSPESGESTYISISTGGNNLGQGLGLWGGASHQAFSRAEWGTVPFSQGRDEFLSSVRAQPPLYQWLFSGLASRLQAFALQGARLWVALCTPSLSRSCAAKEHGLWNEMHLGSNPIFDINRPGYQRTYLDLNFLISKMEFILPII